MDVFVMTSPETVYFMPAVRAEFTQVWGRGSGHASHGCMRGTGGEDQALLTIRRAVFVAHCRHFAVPLQGAIYGMHSAHPLSHPPCLHLPRSRMSWYAPPPLQKDLQPLSLPAVPPLPSPPASFTHRCPGTPPPPNRVALSLVHSLPSSPVPAPHLQMFWYTPSAEGDMDPTL